jgi:hypothetical protein
VLLVVGLESHPEVLHERLHRLDADPARVQVLRLVQEETAAHQSLVRNFAADRDLGLLTRHLQEHPGTQLVVLDSFDRLAGSRYSPAVIRQVLTRLQSIAATRATPTLPDRGDTCGRLARRSSPTACGRSGRSSNRVPRKRKMSFPCQPAVETCPVIGWCL